MFKLRMKASAAAHGCYGGQGWGIEQEGTEETEIFNHGWTRIYTDFFIRNSGNQEWGGGLKRSFNSEWTLNSVYVLNPFFDRRFVGIDNLIYKQPI
jgi:hypothetical protein